MSIKQTNRFLLFSVVVGIIFDFYLSGLSIFEAVGWDLGSVAKYLTIGAAGVLIIRKNNERVLDYLPIDVPMRLQTALMVLLLVFLTYPVCAMLAELGGRFFGNDFETVYELADQELQEQSFAERLVTTAVIPAVFEEMLYRGFFYQGYRKGKGIRTAILLTTFLFGTFHMIAQQAIYAAFAGLMLAVVRELTGSMWPGIWYHFLNNSLDDVEEVIVGFCPAAESFSPMTYLNFNTQANKIFTIVVAIICLPLLYLCLRKVAKIEGKEQEFSCFFKEEKDYSKEKLVTPALVTVLLIEIGFMALLGWYLRLMQELGI